MKKMRKIFIAIINLISLVIIAQNNEMKYNMNSVDYDFNTKREISKLFKNEQINDSRIQIIVTVQNDSTFSIYLKNNCNNTINLSLQDSRVHLIQEAKNEYGIWKPIEFWNFSSCGNSYHSEKVKPNKIIKTISRKYNGNFKTEIRFKLLHDNEVFYSNSVESTINNSQFEIPEELRKSHVYSQALKVSNKDQDFAERIMFLEPNALGELFEKDKKWREQNRK